jgi:hypothetical protein
LQKADSGFFGNWKFPRKRQLDTPVVTAEQALELVMNFPGKMAKKYQVEMSDIISRYLAIQNGV